MDADQVQTVLDNRVAEIEEYEKLFDKFEHTCMHETPHGMHFTVGFGRAVMQAMKKYIQENGHMLGESSTELKPQDKTATG